MRHRARTLLFLASLAAALSVVSSASALDWPVKHEVLTATFGENRSDHFHDGIDIGGGEQAIHPAAEGEVLFTFNEGSDPRDLPTGLGSFVVLQNGPKLRTLYAHMRRGSVIEGKTTVTTADVIGVIGDTGDSLGRHLHFEVIDSAKAEFVNPLTLLPPLADSVSPVIQSVSIERSKKLSPLRSAMSVKAGRVALVVDVYDPSQYVQYFDPMAPYEIEATLNGHQIFHITYAALRDTNGMEYLVSSDQRDFKNYYVSTWTVRLGTMALVPGEARLTVTARDIRGNKASRSFTLKVLGASGQ